MTTIDAHKQKFQELLASVFEEKAKSFPTPLVTLMEQFFNESFDAGRDAEDGNADKGYDNGFAEGFDAGTHQAYVELRGNNDDKAKMQEFGNGLRQRHMLGWARVAKGEYGGESEVYQDNNGAWRWIVRDRKDGVVAKSVSGFTTEYGAKLNMQKELGLVE
jgi:hypothetical protein